MLVLVLSRSDLRGTTRNVTAGTRGACGGRWANTSAEERLKEFAPCLLLSQLAASWRLFAVLAVAFYQSHFTAAVAAHSRGCGLLCWWGLVGPGRDLLRSRRLLSDRRLLAAKNEPATNLPLKQERRQMRKLFERLVRLTAQMADPCRRPLETSRNGGHIHSEGSSVMLSRRLALRVRLGD